MRTAQQIFDTVVNHLRQQNAVCMDGAGNCLYRGPQGMKCAVGCLIPDELYSPRMEYEDLGTLIDKGKLPIPLVEEFTTHQKLLAELQRVHDSREFVWWEPRFQGIAQHFGLVYTPREVL